MEMKNVPLPELSPDRGRKVRLLVSLGIVLAFGIYVAYYFEPKPRIESGPQITGQGTGAGEQASIEIDKTADWKTYDNAKYGFEFEYPFEWRIKPEKVVSLGERFGLVRFALATLEYDTEMGFYEREGGRESFSTWIQDPKKDRVPVLEDQYKDEPGYYQYSNYNSAPLGIFVYVYDDWNSDKQDEALKGHEGFLQYEETVFKGLKAYKGTCAADKNSEDYWPDNPCNWSLEKIEVEKNGRLYVIFCAGADYSSDFEKFLSGFRFTEETELVTDETAN